LLRDATKQLSKRLTREREAQSTTEIWVLLQNVKQMNNCSQISVQVGRWVREWREGLWNDFWRSQRLIRFRWNFEKLRILGERVLGKSTSICFCEMFERFFREKQCFFVFLQLITSAFVFFVCPNHYGTRIAPVRPPKGENSEKPYFFWWNPNWTSKFRRQNCLKTSFLFRSDA
jgi:hypothetical protein